MPFSPLLPAPVMDAVGEALEALVMDPSDAGFAKDHGKPLWTLGWITNTLNDPWQLPVQADRLQAVAEDGGDDAWWNIAAAMMEVAVDGAVAPSPARSEEEHWIAALEREAGVVMASLDRAFDGVDAEDRVYLAASLFGPTFDTEKNAAAREALAGAGMARSLQERVEAEELLLDGTEVARGWLDALQRVDQAALAAAGRGWLRAVRAAAEAAEREADWPEVPRVVPTAWGEVVIGTTGDDVHDRSALLILDPGGDDVYRGAAGAANGLMGHPLAAIVDLGGNDRYASDGLLGAGAALWGAAVVIDAAGDDEVVAAYSGAGAAVFGAAWWEDQAGDDRYRGQAIGQGAGYGGFGFLVDRDGADRYEIGFYGQGFSGVRGWGLLLDRAGDDVYFAGRGRADHERNDGRYLSLAQGFSIGARPHAGGGVAALIDLDGHDLYIADVYGQGVSYYYAAGFLLDRAGHDRYSVHQYGQGCGIHLSLGLLADGSGDDVYSGWILAQGAAHDYAVGMLFDHAGNDTYTADHHAQGRALNNAFALLVDRGGDDAYFGRQRAGSQGIGNEGGFRDYGSLALLVDLGGDDRYSGGFTNGSVTVRRLFGVVADREDGR